MCVLHLFLTTIGANSALGCRESLKKQRMNQGLPKGWSIEGLSIEGLPPEAFLMVVIVAGVIAFAAVTVLAIMLWRSRQTVPAEDPMAALTRTQAEAAARLEAMIGMLAKGQTQLAHTVNERLDSVSHRLGDSLEKTKQSTSENLQKLAERLAIIDRAQKNITDLAGQVTTLQGVLANKQTRGAFGQWRMEAIVQDGLPKGSYAFQSTLSNRTRPDCCVFLPDRRPLVIDAKFPLEAFTAYRDAKTDEERKPAAARLRADVTRHVADIAQKYLIPGETQETAFMFVPSESIYAELHDGFDDLVQKAYRARVVVVSPSILMLAIQVMQQIQRDARMREAADQIRDEVARLAKDVGLLGDRVRKLQTHFNQANEDIRQSIISVEKIEAHGERIQQVELGAELSARPASANGNGLAGTVRRLEAGE
jgi:DNA recombination protein RmuC